MKSCIAIPRRLQGRRQLMISTDTRALLLTHSEPFPDPEPNRGAFSVGSPLPPYMATAPRQHTRRYIHVVNESHNADLYEWCTSVLGEPTRYVCMYAC